jgi:hypothetical protein
MQASPVFYLQNDAYNVFEMMFLGGKIKGLIDCKDFQKVSRFPSLLHVGC